MSRPKRELKRVNLNLSPDVVNLVDKFAGANGFTRTTAITILLINSLKAAGFLNDKD